MTKRAFERIAAGLQDAHDIVEGRAERGRFRVHVPDGVDVGALRKRLGLTQAEFAERFGFTLGRVRDWEQGRTTPEPAHQKYMTVIEKETEAVQRALEIA